MSRTKNFLAVFMFCITILAAAGIRWGNRSQASPRVVWEYKITTAVNNAERTLNELGADGWEFVQFTKDHETSGLNGNYFFRDAQSEQSSFVISARKSLIFV